MSCPKLSALLLLIALLVSGGFIIAENSADAAETSQSSPIRLPIGQATFKIEVEETGIYEITYAMLQSAGMAIESVDPNTLQMMYNGSNVAFEWIGNDDTTFEANEALRFFGLAYDGSRFQQQYVSNNIYWLWANGSPTHVGVQANEAGHAEATHWMSTQVYGEDKFFDFTKTNYDAGWAAVEADSWFWRYLPYGITTTVTIDVPDPVDISGDVTYTVESFSIKRIVGGNHALLTKLNEAPAIQFTGSNVIEGMKRSAAVPASTLVDGENTLQLRPISTVSNDNMFLNEVSLTYPRRFRAVNDQLLFGYDKTGGVGFAVDNLSTDDASKLIVWNVTDHNLPLAIEIDSADVEAAYGFAVNFGRTLTGASEFLVTTTDNIKTPALYKYVPADISAGVGAHWIAISHSEIIDQINRLATHRAATNSLATHVVDVEHIINQYGFGFPTPDGIHSYMQNAYDTWQVKPLYLLLAGDATINPRQRACQIQNSSTCLFPWNVSDLDYVPTYLLHHDPFTGLIPSDHPYALLEGDDLIPDIAVGRITVGNRDANNAFNSNKSLEELAGKIVDKIIQYDTAIVEEQAWTKHIIMLADNADAGGAFCFENQNAASRIPDSFTKSSYCLDDYYDDLAPGQSTSIAYNNMRADFTNEINRDGVSILNYRGHGSVVNWGGQLVDRVHTPLFANNNKPFVVLSADCLDNYFAFNNLISLSEVFMRIENAGAAAHWGSTGLGFSWEHTILHHAFYDGLYEEGLGTIGDAIVYAKTVYESSQGSRSELYAFTLLGDPAMRMPDTTYVPPEPVNFNVYVPIVIKPPLDDFKPYLGSFE